MPAKVRKFRPEFDSRRDEDVEKVSYSGPDVVKGWERAKDTDALGRFTINERGPRPAGSVFPAQRPGRYIRPEQLEGRMW